MKRFFPVHSIARNLGLLANLHVKTPKMTSLCAVAIEKKFSPAKVKKPGIARKFQL